LRRARRLVDNDEIPGSGREDKVLVVASPSKMTRRDKEFAVRVRVVTGMECLVIVRVNTEPPVVVVPVNPQAELFEELVLPLSADTRRRQNESPAHIPAEHQSAERHASRDRLSEPDLVSDKPGAGILSSKAFFDLHLMRKQGDARRRRRKSGRAWKLWRS
jgi:hypothetical protein